MTQPIVPNGPAASGLGNAAAAASGVRILYCRCAYAQVVPAAVKDAVLDGLATADRGFEMVPDLCEMAARRDPHLAELARAGSTLRIAACWPRAVKGLFALADAPLGETGVEILNMRTDSAEAVLVGLLAADGEHPGTTETATINPTEKIATPPTGVGS